MNSDTDANAMTLIRTTVATEDAARKMARRLVKSRFACCVHLDRQISIYPWEGEIKEDNEWIVEARAPAARAEDCWVAMQKDHPYEVPLVEWVADTRVNGAYARWAAELNPES